MRNFKFILIFIFVFMLQFVSVGALNLSDDIVLNEDINEQVVVDGKTVTIDLNGHNIIAPVKNVLYVTNGGKVTITGNGIIESTKNQGIGIENGSEVILESGTIKSVETGVVLFGTSKFTMNGGSIETVDNCGVAGNGSKGAGGYTITINDGTITGNIKTNGYISCGIYHPNEGTLNINGGKIISTNGAGVVQRGGILNITGGEIIAQGESSGKVGDSKILISASALSIDKTAKYPALDSLQTSISGTPILNGSTSDIETLGDDITIEINGGIYNEEPGSEMIPEGYSLYEIVGGDLDGKYVVVNNDDIKLTALNEIINDPTDLDVALVKEKLADGEKVAAYYNIYLALFTNDGLRLAALISEVDEDVEVELDLPELPEVQDGYTRSYKVVRVHEGQSAILNSVVNNSKIKFSSKLFSTYALVYNDVKDDIPEQVVNPTDTDEEKEVKPVSNDEEKEVKPVSNDEEKEVKPASNNVADKTSKNPNTVDNILLYISLFIISVIGISVVWVLKRTKNI